MHFLTLAATLATLLIAGHALAQPQTGDACDPTVQEPTVHLKGEKGVALTRAYICPGGGYELVQMDLIIEEGMTELNLPGEYIPERISMVEIATPCGDATGSARLRGFTTAGGYSEDREVPTITFRPCGLSVSGG